MVQDAEKYREEDEVYEKQMKAINDLENSTYSMRNMVEGEDCKFDDTNKSIIKLKVDETIQWIDNNRSASVDEIEEKQKELTELYMSCQQPDTESEAAAAKGPTIDEVD